jgi:hypothetical protein
MDCQDWSRVVVGKRTGAAGAGTCRVSPRRSEAAVAMAKIEKADTPLRVKVLSLEGVRAIQAYRAANNLTQRLMDQRCSFPAGTINRLEARTAGPGVGQLRQLNSLLKTGLTLE